jgi:hypothetical protein
LARHWAGWTSIRVAVLVSPSSVKVTVTMAFAVVANPAMLS